MRAKIRILAASNKAMQRVGFLKLLAWHATKSETSSLSALSGRIFDTVSKRVSVQPPFSEDLLSYAKHRLADPAYQELREAILANERPVLVEMQDLYLADRSLPSVSGKLHKEGARGFAYLGTSIELVKPGIWSAMTRSVLLSRLTPDAEKEAFEKFMPGSNPLRVSREQGAAVLFCLVEHDADIVVPLFRELLKNGTQSFNERDASDHLAVIIRRAVAAAHKQVLSVEERERLSRLERIAGNLEKWKGKSFSALSVREEHVRVRLEPYCDIGLFVKPEPHRFAYHVTPALSAFVANVGEDGKVEDFLLSRFFSTLATIHGINAVSAGQAIARAALSQAGAAMKSPLGYSPIRECALLAGIHLLFQERLLLEISSSQQILRDWQKEMPEVVRFTVDRMGEPMNVKFPAPRPRAANDPQA